MNGAGITVNVGDATEGVGDAGGAHFAGANDAGEFCLGIVAGDRDAGLRGTYRPVTAGALVTLQIGGHYFAGICKSDTQVQAQSGTLRTLEFKTCGIFWPGTGFSGRSTCRMCGW